MTRYALYFTPSPGSLWAAAGNQWLGREASTGQECAQPAIAGISSTQWMQLTSDARRYGFHATLKAPFRLADGFTEKSLIKMASAFCSLQRPIVLHQPSVGMHRNFLALQVDDQEEVSALATRCVSYFDLLRAAPTAAELARRRRDGLTPRQETLLQRWGYPYTEELFRFHMTLSGSLKDLDAGVADIILQATQKHFAAAAQNEPLTVDGLTILREANPGAPFVEWKRFEFSAETVESTLPNPGRLFYCVGPSVVGKDALLRWTQQHLAGQHRIVFAQRVITRPAHFGELHEAVDFATFWQLAAGGQFSMVWQSNDLCYAIRRDIEADLKAGCDVVVNGSSAYLPQLSRTFPDAVVVWVEAQKNVTRARLEAQQREAGPVSLKRLYRSTGFLPPDEPQVVPLDNSDPLEKAGNRLLRLLGNRQ